VASLAGFTGFPSGPLGLSNLKLRLSGKHSSLEMPDGCPANASPHVADAQRPAGSKDMRSGAPLDTDQGVRQQDHRNTSSASWDREVRFQRLGPNAGGGAERGTGGCLCDVVVVRLVAGIAAGVEGSWFGVCSS
jgi:hypothetical protein